MKRPCVESAPRHKIPYTGGRICSGVSYRIEPNTRPEINTIPSPVFFFLPCHPVPFVEYRNNFLGRKKKGKYPEIDAQRGLPYLFLSLTLLFRRLFNPTSFSGLRLLVRQTSMGTNHVCRQKRRKFTEKRERSTARHYGQRPSGGARRDSGAPRGAHLSRKTFSRAQSAPRSGSLSDAMDFG